MMDVRPPELSRLTLMCRDHEVAELTWDHDRQAVTGKTHVFDAGHAPLMSVDPYGNITRDRLSIWFKNRGIPDFRPDAVERLRAIGFPSAASLMASGFGASLSDQYWIRPAGSASTWSDVNCFENDFSEELGKLLLPHDASSVPSLIEKIRSNADILASSPDAALNGNLPKRWTIEGGQRVLVKSGRASGRFQEPFNEKIASMLCSRLLDMDDYVSYELEDGGFMKWASRCKPITDQATEFVPAYALLCSSKHSSDLGLYDFYVSACAAHGLDVREDVEKMLVIDFLMANFDRHWNNFGVLIDSESREWLRAAPVFDTGEALWCDRELAQPFGGYTTPRAGMMRPFARRIDDQVERHCRDLSWLDLSKLKGFPEQACDILLGNPFIANEPGRIDKIKAAIDLRAMTLTKHARKVCRERSFTVPDTDAASGTASKQAERRL
ncbi:hypothetical protein [Senegalimassilia anaerobia]|uniref:hypothetical protein n=1 Tax=Senegalimassilia anaerobia TaxID=1473216 RepID=UPI0026ED7ABF|nr:hypothetical protein [Senegalimassilia anaerobia]